VFAMVGPDDDDGDDDNDDIPGLRLKSILNLYTRVGDKK